MKTSVVINKTASSAGKFGSATAGYAAGLLVLSKLPELSFLTKIPGVGEWLAKLTPGTLTMLLAYLTSTRFKNDYVEYGATGLGIAGFLDVIRRTGILDWINSKVDTGLKGIGLVNNTGEYPPDYFLKSNWATRPLNGLGESQAFSLQGPFALQGGAMELQGMKGLGLGCMFQ